MRCSFIARSYGPLCKLLEGYMVRILNGKFFVLEASSVCSNVVPRLSVSLLTRVMRVVIWTTRKKELCEDESFSSQTWWHFSNTKLKVKIHSERKRLSSLEFGERWVTVARLCRVVGANLFSAWTSQGLENFELPEGRDHPAQVS